MKPLMIALTKGRIEKEAVKLLSAAGIDCQVLADKRRQLVFTEKKSPYHFLLAKAPDVTTYVKHGIADIGIVGKDTLLEDPYGYYEMLDLEIGKCRFSLASVADFDPDDYKRKTIATKYPTVTEDFFQKKGEDINIIKIEGSVEIAPLVNLADAIVDIVETGSTLKENGLKVFEDICPISTRLIVNKAALKRRRKEIFRLIDQLEEEIIERRQRI